MHDLPSLAPETAAALRRLQCLDDAVAYRAARLAGLCLACLPGGRCAEHASDEQLIAAYRESHDAALREFLSGFDPGEVSDFMSRPGDRQPTELAFALAMNARLREVVTASGPVVVTLVDELVAVELDGGRVVVHPLSPGTGPSDQSF